MLSIEIEISKGQRTTREWRVGEPFPSFTLKDLAMIAFLSIDGDELTFLRAIDPDSELLKRYTGQSRAVVTINKQDAILVVGALREALGATPDPIQETKPAGGDPRDLNYKVRVRCWDCQAEFNYNLVQLQVHQLNGCPNCGQEKPFRIVEDPVGTPVKPRS